MKTKLIDGKLCQERDVVYSDFGAITETDKKIAEIRSEGEYKTEEGRQSRLSDVTYSWTDNENPYTFQSDIDKEFSSEYEDQGEEEAMNTVIQAEVVESDYSEGELVLAEDTEYSTGTLPARLILLKKPLHIQLKDLYREHSRVYKSRGSKMKPEELDLLIEDFRFELLRIVAKAKSRIVMGGAGNMDTILKVSSLAGDQEVSKSLRKMTILFKRIEVAYNKYGFVPRNLQTQLGDGLDILVSHFVIDVYGPELERRKMDSISDKN